MARYSLGQHSVCLLHVHFLHSRRYYDIGAFAFGVFCLFVVKQVVMQTFLNIALQHGGHTWLTFPLGMGIWLCSCPVWILMCLAPTLVWLGLGVLGLTVWGQCPPLLSWVQVISPMFRSGVYFTTMKVSEGILIPPLLRLVPLFL